MDRQAAGQQGSYTGANRESSGVAFRLFGLDGLFNLHIAKFFGIKDFATLQAFNELDVVMPGDDAHSRVFADGGHGSSFVLDSSGFPKGCVFRPVPAFLTPRPDNRLIHAYNSSFPAWGHAESSTSRELFHSRKCDGGANVLPFEEQQTCSLGQIVIMSCAIGNGFLLNFLRAGPMAKVELGGVVESRTVLVVY
ncbi:MAG TPA: hypothetical protein VG225_10860 [Terracidiphilus sp.]|jgi:hypothetical protein|nr:hypothetical protein [Terracidiphilus sp.]